MVVLPCAAEEFQPAQLQLPPSTETICAPLAGLKLPETVVKKMEYTGYLGREIPSGEGTSTIRPFDEAFILVTPGGGGDGVELVERVLSAYELEPGVAPPALLVFGPFMSAQWRETFRRRAEPLAQVQVTTFESRLEALMSQAAGVVAMGGYNTFCEILSFDKPALILPRRKPRMEQYIRASRARELGLVQLVPDRAVNRSSDARQMVHALTELPRMPPPSARAVPGLLSGVERIEVLLDQQLSKSGALQAVAVPAG